MRTALGIYREIGNRGDEAETLNELGTVYHAWGDLDQAAAFHREALDLSRALDNTFNEAVAVAGLGRCAWAAGRREDAEAALSQALEIFQRIGAAEAAEVSAELAELEAAAG
jgi:tetratricopeptide (TPR) repeat protein